MKPSWLISREAFRRSVTANLLVTAIAFLAGFAALQAQTLTTGDVTGSVMDQSGAVVPGATVTITNLEAGTKQTATTNDGGVYRVSFLAPVTTSSPPPRPCRDAFWSCRAGSSSNRRN